MPFIMLAYLTEAQSIIVSNHLAGYFQYKNTECNCCMAQNHSNLKILCTLIFLHSKCGYGSCMAKNHSSVYFHCVAWNASTSWNTWNPVTRNRGNIYSRTDIYCVIKLPMFLIGHRTAVPYDIYTLLKWGVKVVYIYLSQKSLLKKNARSRKYKLLNDLKVWNHREAKKKRGCVELQHTKYCFNT